jgi:two-component system nitrate/nitrite response regulator NarL
MATRKQSDLDCFGNKCSLPGVKAPRVYVLSTIRLLREGLVRDLSCQASVNVVGASDAAALAEILESRPDVLLLDISNSAALEWATSLVRVMPNVKIVALCVAEVDQVLLACAKAGVSGFVYAQGSANDVVAAVHSAVRGELVCSPRTAGMLLNRISSLVGPAGDGSGDALTPREQEVMSFVKEGLSNKQIASLLGIRDATVKNHVHSILGKLRVRRRGEAAARLLHQRRRSDSLAASARPPFGGNGRALDQPA